MTAAAANGHSATLSKQLRTLSQQARAVDQARAKAKRATERVLAYKRAADELESRLRESVRAMGAA